MRALSIAVLGLLTFATAARADGPYEGEWRASTRQIGIELQSWGDDCPGGIPLRQTKPGGTVRISQSGDHLTFSGAVRGTTQGCWSDQPGLRRSAMSHQGETWRISCSTPPSVAQCETGTYTVRAEGEDRLVFEETTRWDWQLNGSRCTATQRSRQTFNRVVQETATPAPVADPEPAGCTAGTPARLVLSPRSADLRPGERVCFRTRVTDAASCTVAGSRVTLSLQAAEGRSARMEGRCFVAGETAAESEGSFTVQAASGDLSASAQVTVASDDLSDLMAQGSGSAVPVSPGVVEASGASGVAARAGSDPGGFPLWWIGALVGLLLVVGVAVVLVVRRKGPAPEPEDSTLRTIPDPEDPPAAPGDAVRATGATQHRQVRVCPVCGHEGGADDEYCPDDGSPLLDPDAPEVRAQGMICPTCRRGYPAGTDRCAADGDELLPYAFYLARQKHDDGAGKKVCPECGTTYGPEKTFCGRDGTPLETVN